MARIELDREGQELMKRHSVARDRAKQAVEELKKIRVEMLNHPNVFKALKEANAFIDVACW